MQNLNWSRRSFVAGTGLVLIASLLLYVLTKDADKALKEVERVGGRTDGRSLIDHELQPVHSVALCDAGITDVEIAEVAPHLLTFPELFTLDLSRSRVTDRGLRELRKLNRVGDLLLRQTQITDDGLANLQGWETLYTLDLMNTRVSDRGLQLIASHCPSLRALDLDGTKITDSGLAHLRALPKLEWLALANTAVSDEGLRHVGALRELRSLSLTSTRVTRVGLNELRDLCHLRTLGLRNTATQPCDVVELKKAIPELEIVR